MMFSHGASKIASVRRFADAVRRWLASVQGRRWLLRGLLAYAVVGFCVWIRRPGDFEGYLIVGDLVLSGRHIYLDAPAGVNTWPPFFSLLSVPLALLATPTPYLARGFWLLLNFACLLLVLRIIARLVYDRALSLRAETPGLSLAAPEVLVPLLLCDRYVSGNFDHLQANIVLFALALGGLYLQATRREGVGSIALGCAAAVKIMPVLFIPYFVYRRRWRAAAYTAAAAAAFSLSPILIFGWERFWNYVAAWRAALAVGWGVGKMNQSVFAMWDRFIGHGLPAFTGSGINDLPESGNSLVPVAVAGTAIVVGALSLWAFRNQSSDRWSDLAEWSIVFIVGALFGPVSWKAYLVVLLLPITLLFAAWRSPGIDARTRRTLGTVLLASFLMGGLTSPGFIGKTLAGTLEMAAFPTLSGLLVLGGCLLLRAHLGGQVHTRGLGALDGLASDQA
jgi:hypothetical protein